jgi:hypothetical protein
MRRSLVLVPVLALLLSSCRLVGAPDAVEIRVVNRSARDFDGVLVLFSVEPEDYGPLPAGGASAYRPVTGAYRYAYVEVRVDTARLVLQPIDFVGETPLDAGRYTYALSLASDRELTLKLERD